MSGNQFKQTILSGRRRQQSRKNYDEDQCNLQAPSYDHMPARPLYSKPASHLFRRICSRLISSIISDVFEIFRVLIWTLIPPIFQLPLWAPRITRNYENNYSSKSSLSALACYPIYLWSLRYISPQAFWCRLGTFWAECTKFRVSALASYPLYLWSLRYNI